MGLMHTMKTVIVVFAACVCWAASCRAAPNLDHFYDIQGTRVYRDHEIPSEWYVAPAPPVLRQRTDNTPDYGFALYRYVGRSGTGDSGSFRVRGVLTFGIERFRDSAVSAKIRKALRAKGFRTPRLKSMPVSAVRSTFMFADKSETREYQTRWKSGSIMVFLDAHMAEVLWDAVKAGQIQVSVCIDEELAGVRNREDAWQPSSASQVRTVPVDMDMTAHSDHFQRIDLGERMKVGYTGVDVFCFDFIENLEENLYAKIVEVAIPTTGRELVEAVTFKDNGEYRHRIEFKLAKDLDQPYRYRVSRIFQDGSKQTGPWQEKSGETLLDITAYNYAGGAAEETGKHDRTVD
ncbi:MAG: hypothetical protein R6U50_13180 [Desulfobacterales bacterium]